MKKFKTLLILTLCFTFMITTTDSYTYHANYEITPLGHYFNEPESK